MSKITYSIEVLYHLNCHNCGGYWSLSEKLPAEIICTHCGFKSIPEAVNIEVSLMKDKISDVFHRNKGSSLLRRSLGMLIRRGFGKEYDTLSFQDFLIELARPDTKYLSTSGIGKKGIDEMRSYFLPETNNNRQKTGG